MTTHTCTIVGAFYRPPASALLDHLPVGAKLVLRAEPTNAYDANAIAVFVPTSSFPASSLATLDGALAGFGRTLAEVLAESEWHVGYLRREIAAELRGSGFTSNADVPAEFTCAPNGAPLVRFEFLQHSTSEDRPMSTREVRHLKTVDITESQTGEWIIHFPKRDVTTKDKNRAKALVLAWSADIDCNAIIWLLKNGKNVKESLDRS